MAQITIWGDFKANDTEHLNLSGELQLLLNKSDINVVNFEGSVKSKGKAIVKSGPNIRQSPDSPQWLEVHGYNVISFANNHIMDFGAEGFQKTKSSFKNALLIGAGTWEEAYRMQIITTEDGLKIGFLAGTHCEFGTLTDKYRDWEGCAWCMHPDFEKKILDRGDADYLIIYNHGGVEYMDMPLPEWRDLYKKWIDMGADAVIAGHPHVPQGWEVYKGKPICYSLGNLCFQKSGTMREHWLESLCAIITVGKLEKADFSIRPIYYDATNNYICDNQSSEFRKHLNDLNNSLANEPSYYAQVNESVLNRYGSYQGMFTRGGWLADPISISFLKGIAEGFKKQHVYNSINCESHRWAMLRAMRLKHGINQM